MKVVGASGPLSKEVRDLDTRSVRVLGILPCARGRTGEAPSVARRAIERSRPIGRPSTHDASRYRPEAIRLAPRAELAPCGHSGLRASRAPGSAGMTIRVMLLDEMSDAEIAEMAASEIPPEHRYSISQIPD